MSYPMHAADTKQTESIDSVKKNKELAQFKGQESPGQDRQ